MYVTLEGRSLVVRNPSPFVVRLSSNVDLLPSQKRLNLFNRNYILPG